MKKVLVILGHPDNNSLNHALATAYAEGVVASGNEVRVLKLGELKFDPILRLGFKGEQQLEPDLVQAQQDILWSDHVVVVFPSWWGSMPALLKGFFDRVFLPGFAFKYRKNSSMWDKLLAGRSARIIVTMDAPYFWNWLMYRNANIRSVKTATLEYCGFKNVKVTVFDRVRFSDVAKREKWLQKTSYLALSDSKTIVVHESSNSNATPVTS